MNYRDWEKDFDARMKAQRREFDRMWKLMPWVIALLALVGLSSLYWGPLLVRLGWEAGKP